MKKKDNLPALVQLAIATLLTTIFWVGFEVYRAFEKVPEPEISSAVLQQLDPTLDQVALDRLVNRITLDDEEIGDTVLSNPQLVEQVQPTPVPIEIEEEIQESTDSGEIILFDLP